VVEVTTLMLFVLGSWLMNVPEGLGGGQVRIVLEPLAPPSARPVNEAGRWSWDEPTAPGVRVAVERRAHRSSAHVAFGGSSPPARLHRMPQDARGAVAAASAPPWFPVGMTAIGVTTNIAAARSKTAGLTRPSVECRRRWL
jgi:hypothetical protein